MESIVATWCGLTVRVESGLTGPSRLQDQGHRGGAGWREVNPDTGSDIYRIKVDE